MVLLLLLLLLLPPSFGRAWTATWTRRTLRLPHGESAVSPRERRAELRKLACLYEQVAHPGVDVLLLQLENKLCCPHYGTFYARSAIE